MLKNFQSCRMPERASYKGKQSCFPSDFFPALHLEIGDCQEPFCNRNNFHFHVHLEERAITQLIHIQDRFGNGCGCCSPELRAYNFFLNVFWTPWLSSTKRMNFANIMNLSIWEAKTNIGQTQRFVIDKQFFTLQAQECSEQPCKSPMKCQFKPEALSFTINMDCHHLWP